jgi:hypothetical protein
MRGYAPEGQMNVKRELIQTKHGFIIRFRDVKTGRFVKEPKQNLTLTLKLQMRSRNQGVVITPTYRPTTNRLNEPSGWMSMNKRQAYDFINRQF